MGSQSDWPTLKNAALILDELQIPFETHIVSAHRTPERLYEYAKTAKGRGLKVIIAGAGGAAHLPGMTAALTPLPVLGVPMATPTLSGQDSLYSIVQMPAGVPVGTLAIGEMGATNAGPAGRTDSRPCGRSAHGAHRSLSRAKGPRPSPTSPRTFEAARHAGAPAGVHDRHFGRRPARAHAGTRGSQARLQDAMSTMTQPAQPPRLQLRRRLGASTISTRSQASRTASMSSPTSSRTCRSLPPRRPSASSRCGRGSRRFRSRRTGSKRRASSIGSGAPGGGLRRHRRA